jgi:hypothetical protein
MIQAIEVRLHHLRLIFRYSVWAQNWFFPGAKAKTPPEKITTAAFAVDMQILKTSGYMVGWYLMLLSFYLPNNHEAFHAAKY